MSPLGHRGREARYLNRFEEAIVSYDRALAFKPDYAEAHSNRGNSLRKSARAQAG